MKQKAQLDKPQSLHLEQLVDFLRLRPNSGKLWLDIIYLVLIAALHLSILPTFTPALVTIDLLTPWLIANFVTQSLTRSVVLGFIGALALETHSAAPAGLYICAYWVILAVLTLVKSPLSWRHRLPWLVTFAAAEIWIISFENLVVTLNGGTVTLDWLFISTQIFRLSFAIGFGLLLIRRWSNLDPSAFDAEEMPV